MLRQFTKRSSRTASWLARAARYVRDRRGAISPILAVGLVPFIGALAITIEGSNWWLTQRAAQNAADSAAIAGAINGTNTGVTSCLSATGDPCYEAKAVTAQYGFTDGSNNVTVTPATNVTCPSPLAATNCVRVIVTKKVPIYLLNVVGFSGDTTIGGRYYQTISARATAYPTGGAVPPFCLVALGTSAKKDLAISGGPNSDLPGCAVGSNGGTDCSGHAIAETIASYAAPGDTNNCAANANFKPASPAITDPYTGQAADIPTNNCGGPGGQSLPASYPQEQKLSKGQLPNWTQITGTPAWSGTTQILCGDVQLTGNVTVAAGTVMVIENGTLDLNGFTFTGNADSVSGKGTTVIFTGPTIPFLSPSHFPSGSGTLNITAPGFATLPGSTWTAPTANWTSFALYQDPALPSGSGIDITSAGNTPTYQINGLVYAPNANVTISGVIGSNTACVGFLTWTLTINGTGNVINAATCDPINLGGEQFLAGRVALVQ
jgi:Flp pilus assembly protein TadG